MVFKLPVRLPHTLWERRSTVNDSLIHHCSHSGDDIQPPYNFLIRFKTFSVIGYSLNIIGSNIECDVFTLFIVAPVSKYGIDDVDQAKCGYATCLCDMEMVRCFKHYKTAINFAEYHGWETLKKKSCAVTGTVLPALLLHASGAATEVTRNGVMFHSAICVRRSLRTKFSGTPLVRSPTGHNN